MFEFNVIIPVRLESERLPRKALIDICGKPMVQRVYEQALLSGAEQVIIATDSTEIKAVVEGFGGHVCMTSKSHQSGTERIAEVINILNLDDDTDIIVNVQGDEPLMPADVIYRVAKDLYERENCNVVTVAHKIVDIAEVFDPDVVKVVMNKRNYAMYFSRAPIPWGKKNFCLDSYNECGAKEIDLLDHYRHVGIYAYKPSFLKKYVEWEPCQLEMIAGLEQLRTLYNCGRIYVHLAHDPIPPGVDNEEDLARVVGLLEEK